MSKPISKIFGKIWTQTFFALTYASHARLNTHRNRFASYFPTTSARYGVDQEAGR